MASASPTSTRRLVQLGEFELDRASGELRKGAVKVRLQEQPLKILELLLEQPGELVSREQIQQRLWPDGTFVEFEHSVNAAVKRLREALGDSVERPQFIETLPKRGYRLIVPVEISEPLAIAQRFPARPWRRRLAMFTVVALAVAAGLVWQQRLLDRPVRIESLAVLPLENLSTNPEEEYFADGMTQALITELGKIQALRVISWHSVKQYKGTNKAVPQIARELNVDALVEGSALRDGDKVRITTQLIQVSPERHLWVGSYDRPLHDVLAIHSDLARAIASQIRVTMTPQDSRRLDAGRRVNPEAYQLYLKGNFYLNKFEPEAHRRALDYFQQAIERDPKYASAYAGMAFAYTEYAWSGSVSPNSVYQKSRQAALKSLELDNSLPEAHIALATVERLFDWDGAGAEQEFKRGIELNPGFSYAQVWYANYLTGMGRFEESVALARQIVQNDPLSPLAYNELGFALEFAGRDAEALQQYQKGLELDPNYGQSHLLLGLWYVRKNRPTEALQHIDLAISALGTIRSPTGLGLSAFVLARSGRRADALNILKELQARAHREYVPGDALAVIYLGLGDNTAAINSLNQAYRNHDIGLVWLKVHWIYDPLRTDPRFQDLMGRIGLD